MKKLIALVLCLALALSLFAGCGSTKDANVNDKAETNTADTGTNKLIIWSYMNEGEPVGEWQRSVTEKYQQMYPDVEIELVFCGRDILTQFQTKLSDPDAEDFPDLVSQSTALLMPLAKEGLLYSLDDALKTPALDIEGNWGDTFVANFMKSNEVNGSTYIIPEGMYTHGFFYDAVMFENLGLEVPQTWEELLNVCDVLKANGIAPVALDGALDLYNEWWFIRFATRLAGMEKLQQAAQGQISWKDDEAFLRAAQYVQEFVDRGYFQSGYEGSVFPAAQALFTQGKAGMLLCGAWIPTEMASQTPDTMEMRMFTLPELPDSESAWHEEIWGNGFAVTASGKNKENAINWLKVFSSMETQGTKAQLKNPSAVIGAPDVTELSNIPSDVARATSTSTNYGALQEYGDWFANVLGPLGTKLITGVMDAQTFIDTLDADTAAYWAKQ